jgi:vacuolar-type H+-ATPase subunit C/Vma6
MRLTSARYALITAFIKGQEARLLTAELMERMLQTSTVQEAIECIRTTAIGSYLAGQPLASFGSADDSLWKYLAACVECLVRYAAPTDIRRLCAVYMRKYDLVNIKGALRQRYAHQRVSRVPVGTLQGSGHSESLANATSTAEIAGVLEKIGLAEYAWIVKDIQEEDLRSVLAAEQRLEQRYYEDLLATLGTLDDATVLVKASRILIDLANLRLVFRRAAGKTGAGLQGFVLEGGYLFSAGAIRDLSTDKIAELPSRLAHTLYHPLAREILRQYEQDRDETVIERVVDREGLRLLKALLSPRVFSPLNALWYLLLKEWEISNVRLILKARFEALPREEISEYL